MSGEEDVKLPAAGSSVFNAELPPANSSQNGERNPSAQMSTGYPLVAAMNVAPAAAAASKPSPYSVIMTSNKTTNDESASVSKKHSSDGDGRSVLDDRWYENLSKLKPCIKDEGIMDYSSITDDKVKQKLMTLLDAKFSFEPVKKRKNADSKPKPKAKRPAKEKSESTTPGNAKVFDNVTTPQMEEEKMAKKKSVSASGELKSEEAELDVAKPAAKASTKKSPASKGTAKKGGKPSYVDMIHEAIVAIKDRTGSSAIAISKWILAHHQHAASINQNMFKSRLNMALKQGPKEEGRDGQEKAEADKKKKEANMTPEERAAALERKKKKEEAEKKKKWIAEQVKRRRFPIEDTRLHSENKEWGVRPRKDVTRPPALPDTLACIIPPHLRTGDRKWSSKNACSNVVHTGGNLSELGPDRDRGLVTDVLQVWHFFCGDVGLADENYPVPKFSVKTMFYALDEVLSGNAKAAKALPPLITHLFVTALKMLSAAQDTSSDAPVDLRLQADLVKLAEGLNAVSWSQIFFYYVELMESYYTSDLSLGPDVLPSEGKLDMSYFWDHVKMDVDNDEPKSEEPIEYNAYIGNPNGVLAKALSKLQRQVEPWALSAEELMAMLRTLTDDILAKRPDLSEDMLGRGAKLYELQKAKRAALVKYNKVRLAYEGPKKPSRPRKADNDAKKEDAVKGSAGDEGTGNDSKVEEEDEEEEKEEEEKPFVPTATKKQFETAQKAWVKAHEAFENGITKLVSRSEPIGFDRHHNAFYVFRHDPEMVHIERLKPMSLTDELKLLGVELNPFSSWHVIDTKPLFEQFLGCLDDRELTILKRRLHDGKQDNTRVQAREKEVEDLQRRLENAKSACDAADGRRSGRLAGNAEDDLKKIEEEIKFTLEAHQEEERQEKSGREKATDYFSLTGLQMVMDLHASAGKKQTRSSRKTEEVVETGNPSIADMTCDKLWWDDKVGGNGTVNVLVNALLEMEDKCNDLSPWRRHDTTRDEWRNQLSAASVAWTQDCSMQLGPSAEHEDEMTSASLRMSHATIVASIKGSLKDLELRVFEISGQKKAVEEADTAEEDGGAQSDDEDDADQKKRGQDWKLKINALNRVPTPKYTLIRDIIVAAITVARKAHLNQVAAELKAALQLHRPHAAGEAKVAAIAVLEKYGGYDASGDEEEDVDFDELAAVDAPAESPDNEADGAAITSMLCSEAIMMSGSIGGDDDADPYDWSDAIKECKSLSRLAALSQCFLSKAYDVVARIELERGELDSLLGLNAKRQSRSKKASNIKKSRDSSVAIWCDSKLTDRLVKAKVTNYPWWPARVCEPLDPLIAEGVKDCGHIVISSVGNPGMFLVPEKDVVDFIEETEDDLSLDAEVATSLRESTAIAKKLWRRQHVGVQSPWSKSRDLASLKRRRPRAS
ncbi:hypothetical protein QTG54_004334 [Skeletonema marinoi]|uniref:PWWP domain-containing protein n=1 Tax=Skeletonema marinoi TaxID=267567 RepID=A0AAD8YEU4_9STRA|nr:hypothetical protein QTG54_004334 [Skeletonema marinoi]